MKNIYKYLIISILAILIISCEQTTTKKSNTSKEETKATSAVKDLEYPEDIVGTYLSVENEEGENGLMISIESEETFSENGFYSATGIMSVIFFDEEAGKIKLKYDLFFTGKYKIKNSVISYNYSINSLKVSPQITGSTTYIEQIMYESITDQLLSVMKETLINEDTDDEIVEISKTRLVTKDSDGKKTIRTRLK
jgi:hypothetical protein